MISITRRKFSGDTTSTAPLGHATPALLTRTSTPSGSDAVVMLTGSATAIDNACGSDCVGALASLALTVQAQNYPNKPVKLVIPFAPGMQLADLNVGVLFLIAIATVNTPAVFLAGWSSNNKYALLGAMRTIAMPL